MKGHGLRPEPLRLPTFPESVRLQIRRGARIPDCVQ